jgi:hypothetical protein
VRAAEGVRYERGLLRGGPLVVRARVAPFVDPGRLKSGGRRQRSAAFGGKKVPLTRLTALAKDPGRGEGRVAKKVPLPRLTALAKDPGRGEGRVANKVPLPKDPLPSGRVAPVVAPGRGGRGGRGVSGRRVHVSERLRGAPLVCSCRRASFAPWRPPLVSHSPIGSAGSGGLSGGLFAAPSSPTSAALTLWARAPLGGPVRRRQRLWRRRGKSGPSLSGSYRRPKGRRRPAPYPGRVGRAREAREARASRSSPSFLTRTRLVRHRGVVKVVLGRAKRAPIVAKGGCMGRLVK